MQVRGIAHLQHDVGRQRAHPRDNALWQDALVPADHHHRHGLPHGTSQPQHNPRHNAPSCRRQLRKEHAALLGGTQGKGALVVACRHPTDRCLRHTDDGGQNHDAQQDGGRQHSLAAASHQLPNEGHNHHEAEEAVDDGGNASHQIHCRLQQTIGPWGAEPSHKHGAEEPQGHPHHHGSRRDAEAAYNHGKDAEPSLQRSPAAAQKEFLPADFRHGRQALSQKEEADCHHRHHRDAGGTQEHQPHSPLPHLLHPVPPVGPLPAASHLGKIPLNDSVHLSQFVLAIRQALRQSAPVRQAAPAFRSNPGWLPCRCP